MARERRRTVAPAKVSPCQSAEKACTRLKPSVVISCIVQAASGVQNRMAMFLSTAKVR